MRTVPVLIIPYRARMINRMFEHPTDHIRAEEHRNDLLAAAAQRRLLSGSGRSRRPRRLARRAGGWVSRVVRGEPS